MKISEIKMQDIFDYLKIDESDADADVRRELATFKDAAVGYLIKSVKQTKEDGDSVKKGVQALLRAQMINDWNHYSKKGYAPIYARQNFENCWAQYHSLGANGVMDDIHEKFLDLPDKDPKKHDE